MVIVITYNKRHLSMIFSKKKEEKIYESSFNFEKKKYGSSCGRLREGFQGKLIPISNDGYIRMGNVHQSPEALCFSKYNHLSRVSIVTDNARPH